MVNLWESTQKLLNCAQTNNHLTQLSENELGKLYQELIDTLTEHNHLYYIEASPIISDVEYDQLFAYLKKIEEFAPYLISSNSPTQSLIWQIAEGFEKADHKIALLSLENSYNASDILARDQRRKKIVEKTDISNTIDIQNQIFYLLEPKFDGLSVEIIYQNWQLTQAITRWDGKTWEDITTNIKTLKNLPKTLTQAIDLRIRGEVMMSKSQLKSLNNTREEQGLNLFANTRNAAAGSLKLLDSWEVAKRGLVCFLYDILETNTPNIDLGSLGLPVFSLPAQFQTHQSIQSLISACENAELKSFLDEQDFDFDGLVIKLTQKKITNTDFWIREFLGSTEHHPRRAIAYKFPAQQIATQIRSINFQVGRTGIITPVANLTPVTLSWATISRVSLHNFDFINQKEILNWDFVRIQRSGEVIPYVLWPIKDRRTQNESQILAPEYCPSCWSKIQYQDPHYFCQNPNCPAQLKEKISYFVSRDAMDIWGIGDAIIDILVEQKILTNIADLYSLLEVKNQILLRKLPSFWEKKVTEICQQLTSSKNNPLRRLLNGLGIPNIWKKTAQDLASYLTEKKVQNLNDLLDHLQKTEELWAIYGIWEKIALSIQLFFSSPSTISILKALENYGLSFSAIESPVLKEDWAKHFSITGSFPLSRTHISKHLIDQGYIFDETPNQHTDFILIGEKAGSKKEKAQKLNLTIYDNRELICQTFNIPQHQIIENQKKSPKSDSTAQSFSQGGLF